MRTLLLLLAVSSLPIEARGQAASTQEQWHVYRDDVNGFSFRYPPTLHVIEKPVEPWHIEGLVRAVLLVTDPSSADSRTYPVLQIMLVKCGPMAYCPGRQELRVACKRFKVLPFGNTQAFQCIDYGRAACHWSAEVLLNGKSLTVYTRATDQAANTSEPAFQTLGECADRLVPAMSAYPIQEMFASFRFEPSMLAHAWKAR